MQQQIERFLTYMTSDKKASGNTIAAYRNDLLQFLQLLQEPVLTSQPAPASWQEVNVGLILRYESYIKTQRYAVTTIARKVASVRSFLEYLQTTGVMAEHLGSYLVAPRVERTAARTLQQTDIDTLLTAPTKETTPAAMRDRAMLELLYTTGMRIGELVSLDVSNVDLAERVIRCAAGKRRSRLIALNSEACEALRHYIEDGRTFLLFEPDEPSLFLNHRGQRLTRQGLWLIIKQYAQQNGLTSTLTPYTLRNSFSNNTRRGSNMLADVFHRPAQRDVPFTHTMSHGTTNPRHELIIDGKVVSFSY